MTPGPALALLCLSQLLLMAETERKLAVNKAIIECRGHVCVLLCLSGTAGLDFAGECLNSLLHKLHSHLLSGKQCKALSLALIKNMAGGGTVSIPRGPAGSWVSEARGSQRGAEGELLGEPKWPRVSWHCFALCPCRALGALPGLAVLCVMSL